MRCLRWSDSRSFGKGGEHGNPACRVVPSRDVTSWYAPTRNIVVARGTGRRRSSPVTISVNAGADGTWFLKRRIGDDAVGTGRLLVLMQASDSELADQQHVAVRER